MTLRIIFAGTPKNAASTLEALVSAGVEIVGVLTREDSPVGRSGTPSPSPVALTGTQCGIPVYKSNTFDESTKQWIKHLDPDLGVIVAYGAILRSETLDIPKLGWINLHYSLLPEFRGASPVQQAILEGRLVTGVTVFQLDEGIDSGPILSSAEVSIDPSLNAGELLEELTEEGTKLLVSTLANFGSLASAKRAQPSSSLTVLTRKISRLDARFDFAKDATTLSNLVRAMNPEPVAWFEFESSPVRVLEALALPDVVLEKGEAKIIDSSLVVGCESGGLLLRIIQPAGRKPMSGADWFRGVRRESLLFS